MPEAATSAAAQITEQWMVEMVHCRITTGETTWFQRLLYCDVESKWKNYYISTFPGQSASKSLEEAMDLSQDRLLLELR
jgi:hypothetical protein